MTEECRIPISDSPLNNHDPSVRGFSLSPLSEDINDKEKTIAENYRDTADPACYPPEVPIMAIRDGENHRDPANLIYRKDLSCSVDHPDSRAFASIMKTNGQHVRDMNSNKYGSFPDKRLFKRCYNNSKTFKCSHSGFQARGFHKDPNSGCITNELEVVNKIRNEFLIITQKSGIKSEIHGKGWYNTLFQCGIFVYGLLLGISTLFDWNTLSSDWLRSTLFIRFAFTSFFLLDFCLRIKDTNLFTLLRRPYFVADLILLIYDVITLIYLVVMLRKNCDVANVAQIGLNSECKSLRITLRYLSCFSLLRLYKVCDMCQPLLSLSKGILLSIKSLCWTGVFVLLVIYGSSIFATWTFNDVLDEEMDSFWGTLPRSMYTLFTVLTLEGWNEVSNRTALHYPNCKIFFVLFVCFATLTVMNVVTGIILDTYISASETLTAEKQYKGTFDRHCEIAGILNDALNYMKMESSLNRRFFSKDFDGSNMDVSGMPKACFDAATRGTCPDYSVIEDCYLQNYRDQATKKCNNAERCTHSTHDGKFLLSQLYKNYFHEDSPVEYHKNGPKVTSRNSDLSLRYTFDEKRTGSAAPDPKRLWKCRVGERRHLSRLGIIFKSLCGNKIYKCHQISKIKGNSASNSCYWGSSAFKHSKLQDKEYSRFDMKSLSTNEYSMEKEPSQGKFTENRVTAIGETDSINHSNYGIKNYLLFMRSNSMPNMIGIAAKNTKDKEATYSNEVFVEFPDKTPRRMIVDPKPACASDGQTCKNKDFNFSYRLHGRINEKGNTQGLHVYNKNHGYLSGKGQYDVSSGTCFTGKEPNPSNLSHGLSSMSEHNNECFEGESVASILEEPLEVRRNDTFDVDGIIDMSIQDPFEILSDPIMERALSLANIPMYQAYDVLNLYWTNGLKRMTASEFAEACSRIAGNATSKQLLSFELAFKRRLNEIDRAISGINDKINMLIDMLSVQ